MQSVNDGPNSLDKSRLKVRRTQRIILWVMAVLMLLPFVLVWLTGEVGF